MIRQAFKRLWNDKRGNVLIIAGLASPLLFGSVGLATDTIQWTLWKRQLQRSADSAAYSGVYARFQDASSTTAATSVVTRDLANAKLTSALLSGYPLVTEPTDTSAYRKTVQVRIDAQSSLAFSSMFMSAAPIISVTARAAAVDSGLFCVVALENEPSEPGIIIQGSADVNMGCGMISNSPAASVSVDVIGSGHRVTAEPVAGVGGVPDINGVTTEQSFHLSQPDPYAGLYSTDPGTETCTAFSHASKTNADGTKKPGCYNDFDPSNNSTTNLSPGVYYLNNASIDIQSNTVINGTGVTLIFTGTNPGSIETSGNALINLAAPTTGPYAKMLMIQSTAAGLGNESTFTGNSGFKMDGVIYFPRGKLTFTGSSGPASKCAMIVARRVHFSGSTNVQNDTSGCANNTKVPGFAIRLIA